MSYAELTERSLAIMWWRKNCQKFSDGAGASIPLLEVQQVGFRRCPRLFALS